MVTRRVSFEVAHFGPTHTWPKAILHRSLGQRPRKAGEPGILAKGHIHATQRLRWVWPSAKETRNAPNSWGGAPGYGDRRPLAKRTAKSVQLQNTCARESVNDAQHFQSCRQYFVQRHQQSSGDHRSRPRFECRRHDHHPCQSTRASPPVW